MAALRHEMSARFIIGLTGASGAEYGLRLLWQLSFVPGASEIIFSSNFFKVLSAEAATESDLTSLAQLTDLLKSRYGNPGTAHKFELVDVRDIGARAASGSAHYQAMVVAPCSMKTLAAIASGLSSNLIERAADVSLKERRPLILCPRETPLSQIHLSNMLKLSQAGATILPLMPGYYNQPQTLNDLYDFVIDRIFSHCGIEKRVIPAWKS